MLWVGGPIRSTFSFIKYSALSIGIGYNTPQKSEMVWSCSHQCLFLFWAPSWRQCRNRWKAEGSMILFFSCNVTQIWGFQGCVNTHLIFSNQFWISFMCFQYRTTYQICGHVSWMRPVRLDFARSGFRCWQLAQKHVNVHTKLSRIINAFTIQLHTGHL